jgi:hypothetical protein
MKPPKPDTVREWREHPPVVRGPASDRGCKWTELPAESLAPPADTRLNCREDDTVFLKLAFPAIVQPEPEFSVSRPIHDPASALRGHIPNQGLRDWFAWPGRQAMKPHIQKPELTDDEAAQYTAWALVIAALIAPVPFAAEVNPWSWIIPATWFGLFAWAWSRSR